MQAHLDFGLLINIGRCAIAYGGQYRINRHHSADDEGDED